MEKNKSWRSHLLKKVPNLRQLSSLGSEHTGKRYSGEKTPQNMNLLGNNFFSLFFGHFSYAEFRGGKNKKMGV